MPKKKAPEEGAKKVINPNVMGLRPEVLEQPITETLEINYMPYAMSVIVSGCFAAYRQWISFSGVVCICCQIVLLICFCKILLCVFSCGDYYTSFALDLLSFRASHPWSGI